MDIIHKIAEQRIADAIIKGELDDLEGAGSPLKLDDDPNVPEDLRMCYRIMKNSGMIPPEVELLNDVISLRSLIDKLDDDKERLNEVRKLNFKLLRLNEMMGRPLCIDISPGYEIKFYNKML